MKVSLLSSYISRIFVQLPTPYSYKEYEGTFDIITYEAMATNLFLCSIHMLDYTRMRTDSCKITLKKDNVLKENAGKNGNFFSMNFQMVL